MPFYQFDASAIVKRYVEEIGSDWVRAVADAAAGNGVSIADVTRAEVASAVTRRGREGTLDAEVVAESLRTFHTDCALQYRVVPTEHVIVSRAVDLLQQHPLRAYDAIQLATVVRLNELFLRGGLPPLVFVSADDELLAAAGAEGLATENPNQHP